MQYVTIDYINVLRGGNSLRILVAGGLGYIGSHTVVELINAGYDVVIADDLSNSTIDVLENIEGITGIKPELYEINVACRDKTKELFEKYTFEAVIHFAGFKAVGESVTKPLMYYKNNIMTTINLSELCIEYNVNKFIFSSSATVYGENIAPFKEDMALLPTTNPYGETKAMCERILKDVSNVNKDFSVALLRYFNPIGAHESGKLLEKPKGKPNNLMPYITEVARGNQEKLYIFGDDYDTKDGTGIRDYIHVVDLARGHVLALKNLGTGCNVYNLGTGEGLSVFDVVKNFENVHNLAIPYEIVKRRDGDIAICFADCEKAKIELGFETRYKIEDMCRDSFKK